MTNRTLADPNAIPRDLWSHPHFVDWHYVDTGRPKPEKKPVNPRTLGGAGVQWPNTWSTIHQAVDTYKRNSWLDGIGFMLTLRVKVTMIDLDNCVIGSQLSPFAAEIVEALQTYYEISPSGRGVRLLLRCDQPPVNRKTEAIEIYSSQRYCTLTGNVLRRLPLATVDNLDWFVRRYLPEQQQSNSRPTAFFEGHHSAPSEDAELWQRIFAKNDLARRLYNGDLSAAHGDHSRAVILLLNSLAYWTHGDGARMAKMIRESSLDPAKFDAKRGDGSWLDWRIGDAINFMAGGR